MGPHATRALRLRPALRVGTSPGALARLALAAAIAALGPIGGVGCGSETPDTAEVPDTVAAATETPPETPSGGVARVASVETTGRPTTTFPHDPHRAIACHTCHVSVASHATHEQIECTECHAVPTHLDSLRVLSDAECLDCHHSGRAGVTCSDCHRPTTLAREISVSAALEIAAAGRTRQALLPFDHAWHREQSCADCHAPSVLHEFGTECRSCHTEHHGPDAPCTWCHASVDRPVHAEAAHSGCGGAGCHVDPRILNLPPVRSICLACHTDMVDHEKDRECAACHAIPDSWPGPDAAPGEWR